MQVLNIKARSRKNKAESSGGKPYSELYNVLYEIRPCLLWFVYDGGDRGETTNYIMLTDPKVTN